MRILWSDAVPNAAITATNANSNYPAQNVSHVFMRKRYQCLSTSDTLTFSFASAVTISAIFYGFHNLTSLTFRLYDGTPTLLKTVTISSPEDYGSEYFAAVSGVMSVELDIVGPSGCYLGKVSAGEYYDAPIQNIDFLEPIVDNSIVARSAGGQVLSSKITPLLGYDMRLMKNTRAEWLAFRAYYRSVGLGATIWVDFNENDHTYAAPLYCAMTDPPELQKDADWHSWTFKVLEAR